MPLSPRLQWPYPSENQDPWWDGFVALVQAMDNSVFAAMEDRNIVLMGGGTMAFTASSGLLAWDDDIEINSPVSGFRHTIAADDITVADNAMVYVEVSRNLTANAVLTLATATAQPPGAATESFFVLCLRRGDRLYFRNGDILSDGESRELLQADSGSGGSSGDAFTWFMGGA